MRILRRLFSMFSRGAATGGRTHTHTHRTGTAVGTRRRGGIGSLVRRFLR